MKNGFNSANQKIQDLMTLYEQLDCLPNRNQWHFEPQYQDGASCAFVFSHTTTDVSQRWDTLNLLANVLSRGGIKSSIIARGGLMSDVIIKPEYTELARKIFSKYQTNAHDVNKTNYASLEQEWLRKIHGNQL